MNSLEREFVHNTYQRIYKHFDTSRAYLWKSVREFLDNIKPYDIIVEIGSGNGKNMLHRQDCINIAFDLCSNFTKITYERGVDSITANNLYIPVRDNFADAVLSIAVIHHLSNYDRRLKCIQELVRIIKPGGKLLIQVWAFEQYEKSKNKFTKSDNYIEFNSSDKTVSEMRYYHVFREGELDEMFSHVPQFKILKSYWEMGNWIILGEKLPPL